ncbi:DHHC palmitoyltransferase-domain-containing protein [Crepidotus variabilis]|uniref:Palmitoyltransferase n=1 Tax=Crepidotus variabilis TaxID=179855 RepID=A0A9P6EQH7_9AGAR|nr:DHHC palmitoyltransferase-domain-containing protein [Crepidotus variabilis]
MSSARRSPLLSFTRSELRSAVESITFNPNPSPLPNDPDAPRKRWYHYLPLCGTLFMILGPQPSWLYVLVDFHLRTLNKPHLTVIHIAVSYTLTFMAFSSLIVCLARDPGPPNALSRLEGATSEGEDVDMREALMPNNDFSSPSKWCRKCWAPKPERTHHCSLCGRCVLKMDHHCPWIGAKCIGHRTYPAFLHFLVSVSLLSAYVSGVCGHALWYSFNHPFVVNEVTPIHELVLMFYGAVFALIVGSFACYHIYLISTNQTTLENISPFLLLRHLPPLPSTGHSLSDPPLEPELAFSQRRIVKDAHANVFLYNIGFRKNWAQAFGYTTKSQLLFRLWCGGASPGDGKIFPRNPRAEVMLSRLARELVELDDDR